MRLSWRGHRAPRQSTRRPTQPPRTPSSPNEETRHATRPDHVRIPLPRNVGWGLGALVCAVDGFVVMEEFAAEAGQAYFMRFRHGERLEAERGRALMSTLENVTAVPAE